jgi:outer membrane protein W
MIRIWLFSLLLITFLDTSLSAQERRGSVEAGVRAGIPLGVSGRYFFHDKIAGEAIVGLYNKTASLTLLGQYHFDLGPLTIPGFGWYFGAGAHIGTRKEGQKQQGYSGISGIAGIEYNFTKIPLNLSLDWKPAIHFNIPADPAEFGFTARYIFRKTKNKP